MPDGGGRRERDQLSQPNVKLYQFPLSLAHVKFQLKYPALATLSPPEKDERVTVSLHPAPMIVPTTNDNMSYRLHEGPFEDQDKHFMKLLTSSISTSTSATRRI